MKIKIGKAPAQNGLSVEGGKYQTLSSDGINLNGDYHKDGGTIVSSNGEVVEAERNEPIYTGSDGDNYVFGNLKNPITGQKFKNQGRALLQEKGKFETKMDKANDIMSEADEYSKFGSLDFNTGEVQMSAARMNVNRLKGELDTLAQVQDNMLGYIDATGADPKSISKSMKKNGGSIKARITGIPQAKDGKKLPAFLDPTFGQIQPIFGTQQQQAQTVAPVQQAKPSLADEQYVRNWVQNSKDVAGNPGFGGTIRPEGLQGDQSFYVDYAEQAAQKYGINPETYIKQIYQESGFQPGRKSSAGALGIAQFMPATAKGFGLTPAQLKSTKKEDVVAQLDAGAKYMSQLKGQLNGDEQLALAAYNGGVKNIKGNLRTLSQRTGKPVESLTGNDWFQFMNTRQDLAGGQRQTVDYFSNILSTPTSEFYKDSSGKVKQFSQAYYDNEPPPQTQEEYNQLRKNNTPLQPLPSVGLQQIPTEPLQGQPMSMLPSRQPAGARPQAAAPARPRTRQLNPLNYLGEIAAILDQPDYVQGQQFNPVLMTPYRVSMQDQINQNTSSFNALSRNMANNPEALATLAGQKYEQDQKVLGNEFRTNQGIQNQVLNQNNQILNQAQMTNLQLADTQYQRQAGAQANTDANRQAALASISNKYSQNQLNNQSIQQTYDSQQRQANLYGNMYQNYQFDQEGNVIFNDQGGYQFNYNGFGGNDQDAFYRYQAQQNQLKKQAKANAAQSVSRKKLGYKFK